ncbi:MAG: hypothetical protein BWX64_02308 [Acidobacteria bacterium ADurb.Bin051]|nr:MAG: hypothetical protein BWX64_02308 [Acidobacteria bacterium ADurb.Bin051]
MQLVGVDLRGRAQNGSDLRAAPQDACDRRGEPILQTEDLLEGAGEPLARDLGARRDLDQTRRDPQLGRRALVTARNDPAAAEAPAESDLFLFAHRAPPRGAELAQLLARGDGDPRKPQEVTPQALGEPTADPVVVGVSRKVAEVDDRQAVGQRRHELARRKGAQIGEHRGRRRISGLAILGEGAREDRMQPARRSLPELHPRLGVEDRDDSLGDAFAGEGRTARQGLAEHRSEREDVRARVHDLAAELLRRHVAEGPHDPARPGQGDGRLLLRVALSAREQAGDAEVEQLGEAVGREHDVLRLDVAVQDAGGVRVHQRFEQTARHRVEFAAGERPPLQPLPQGLTRHELHREVDGTGILSGLVEGGDRRMLQPGARLPLAQEARPGFGGEREREDLDRGGPPERQILGAKDLAHPARPEPLAEPVMGQDPTGRSARGRLRARSRHAPAVARQAISTPRHRSPVPAQGYCGAGADGRSVTGPQAAGGAPGDRRRRGRPHRAGAGSRCRRERSYCFTATAAAAFRRSSRARSAISVTSRFSSLQPYQSA